MYDAKDQYEELLKSAESTPGPPDVYMFLHMLNALNEHGDVGGKNKQFLKSLCEKLQHLQPNDIANTVKICSVKPCGEGNQGKSKITINAAIESVRSGLIECFNQVPGTIHKNSRPPPSGLEDDMSKWLQALSVA